MPHFEKMLIIGCGNMGGAMLAGWLAAGEDPARFTVLDPQLGAVPEGVELIRDASEAGAHDCVLLGFKPQQLGAIAPGIQSLTGQEVTVFSLLAGLDRETLRNAFPAAHAHVRVMPNLASRIGKSPVIMCESGLTESEKPAALDLFGKLGTALWLEDESKFDIVTALAGSGPGFVYRFIDALASAAVSLGVEPDMAGRLALATVEGSAALAAGAEISPGELADRVASPGGMTREGLNILDEDNALKILLVETLRATADKGAELGRGAAKQP